jgi:hypothetical protein
MRSFPVPRLPRVGEVPFVGTRPFEKDDQFYFFGREQEASRLANMVIANNLSVLYGDSGVGKSSLLNARLPLNLEERQPDWLIISFSEWQLGCESKLAEIVAKETKLPKEEHLAKSLTSIATAELRPVLLILDQFEEFFLYYQDGKSQLVPELARVVNRRSNSVKVLLSLRSDGLFLLDKLRIHVPNIFESMMLLEALHVDAAIDCIIHPIEAFNTKFPSQTVEVPARDSDLVRALVAGSLQKQIMRELPSSGRGKIDQSASSDVRVVAPFLQLALIALWTDCIVSKKARNLDLDALRRIAGLPEKSRENNTDYDSYAAVGILARKYVGSILNQFGGEKRDVCATILERMVLPSGQKVSVKLVDVSTDLSLKQKQFAEEILDKLSDESKLLKKVALPSSEGEFAFQIIHDAMAAPVLNWVEGCRRTRKIEAENKKNIFKIFSCALALLVAVLTYMAIRNDYQSEVERLTNFASQDPRPGFRLPILLSLSALSKGNNPIWMMSNKSAIAALENRLRQSPRDAGTFPAFGFDTNRNTIAWIDKDKRELFWCDLETTFECIGSKKNKSRDLRNLSDTSSNSLLANMPLETVGFVSDIEDPVIVSKGMLYYWQNDKPKKADLNVLLEKFISRKTGFPIIDVIGGGIRVQLSNWLVKETYVAYIKTDRKLDPPFDVSGDVLFVKWHALADWAPAISQDGKFAASVTGTRSLAAEVESLAGCYGFKGQFDAGLNNKTYSLSIWSTEQPVSKPLCVSPLPLPQFEAGLGYASDKRNLALLFQRHMRLFSASNLTAEAEEFGFKRDFGQINPVLGAQYAFPPIAATRSRLGSNEREYWSFAWQTLGGVRVAQQINGEHQLVSSNEDKSHIRDKFLYGGPSPPDRPPLLASRIDLSADGQFLIMQVLDLPRKEVSVFIWQITNKWRDMLVEIGSNSDKLRELACRIAAFDPSNYVDGLARYTQEELLEWHTTQPCETSAMERRRNAN